MARFVLVSGGLPWQTWLRQLWAWHRHVRTTVAMELATALNHSAQPVEAPREGAEHEKNVGLWAQKPPLPGKRPGVLTEPEAQSSPPSASLPPTHRATATEDSTSRDAPWRLEGARGAVEAVTVGYVAAAVPLPTLGLPVLAGASGEAIDAPLLRCITVVAQQCQDSEPGKAWSKMDKGRKFLGKVVDVPVIINDEFQQFIYRLLVFQL